MCRLGDVSTEDGGVDDLIFDEFLLAENESEAIFSTSGKKIAAEEFRAPFDKIKKWENVQN